MSHHARLAVFQRPRRLGVVLLAAVALVAAALGLAVDTSAQRSRAPEPAPACAPRVGLLGFSDALDKRTFEGTRVGGLSGLAYDRRRNVYYGLLDNDGDTPARFYTLRLPVGENGLAEAQIVDVTVLRDADGEPFTGESLDGEGIALDRRGELLVASETEPSIRRFSLEGELLGRLTVPERFLVAPEGQATANRTFESLDLSPNAHSLFTATEGPLAADGATREDRGRIRILRYEDRGPGGFEPAEQFFYLTEPGQSVVEIVALSESELLVLERGFVPGEGNTIRIFRVSLDGAPDVSDEPTLARAGQEPVDKTLLADLADCPSAGAESPGTQENPLLDNFEALELGPRLRGGRRALLLVSDDNFNDVQVTRVVALAARLHPPAKAERRPKEGPRDTRPRGRHER